MDTRFEVTRAPADQSRVTQPAELEQLKERLLRERLQEVEQHDLDPPLRRAANDAAALAWITPFPLLLLPILLDEKITAARQQAERQCAVKNRSQRLMRTTT